MIDKIDKEILRLVQQDAKMTNKEIAARLGMTITPIFERIKRLERDDYVLGYNARIDRHKIDLPIAAYCTISLDSHHFEFLEQFEKDVQQLEEVVECYHIAGMFDYLLKIYVASMEDYQQFVSKKLAKLPNLRKVQSSFVMTEVKKANGLPIK